MNFTLGILISRLERVATTLTLPVQQKRDCLCIALSFGGPTTRQMAYETALNGPLFAIWNQIPYLEAKSNLYLTNRDNSLFRVTFSFSSQSECHGVLSCR